MWGGTFATLRVTIPTRSCAIEKTALYSVYSGVSRRLRRLAGIETAFGHQNGPTRRRPDDHKSEPPIPGRSIQKMIHFYFAFYAS